MRKLALIDVLSIAAVLAVTALTLPHRPATSPTEVHSTLPQVAADAPRYQLLDLGAPKGDTFFAASAASPNCRYLTGYAGKRVGREWVWRAVLRTNGGFRDLGKNNTDQELTLVSGVNDQGTAAGVTIANQSEPHAVVWDNGKMRRVFPEEADTSAALGIDREGNVFGARLVGDEVCAFIRTPQGNGVDFKNKPGQSTVCYAANDEKQFLISVYDANTERATALLWDKNGKHDLPALAEDQTSVPIAINAGGKIVGCCVDSEDNLFATRWKDGKVIPLRIPGNLPGIATSINAQSDIVGVALRGEKSPPIPFLRQKGNFYNLNECVDNKADLRRAVRITDDGAIAAIGIVGGDPHTFLLQPK